MLDGFDTGRGFFEGTETEDAFTLRINPREAGVFDDYRLSHGKVTGASAAEPAALARHVRFLGDRALAAGFADVIAIALHRRGAIGGVDDDPTFAGDLFARRRTRECDLEPRRDPARQRHEAAKLDVLAAVHP